MLSAGCSTPDGLVRKLVLEAFKQSRGKALEAIQRGLETRRPSKTCWSCSPGSRESSRGMPRLALAE